MKTTAGCKALQGAKPKLETTVIRKLREQGAILLGKTALTQWANYRSPQTAPNGWSSVGGQCIAPYAEYQDPSGSSSGSAVSGTDFASMLVLREMEGSPILLDDDDTRRAATQDVIEVMRSLGAIIVENVEFAQWETDAQRRDDEEWHHAFRVQLGNNMAKFLDSFSSKPNDFQPVADVINYTMSASEERGEEYGIQEWLVAEKIGQSYDHKPQEYITSLKRRLALGAQAKELFDRYQYDIYLCSASRWQPAMASGYPTISKPVGQFLPETPINSRPKTGMIQKAPGIPWVTPPARVNLDD
ncbi:putative amidase [Talaromyces pinophilus]|nr:putative amidase [Talaromyces pinophilus]